MPGFFRALRHTIGSSITKGRRQLGVETQSRLWLHLLPAGFDVLGAPKPVLIQAKELWRWFGAGADRGLASPALLAWCAGFIRAVEFGGGAKIWLLSDNFTGFSNWASVQAFDGRARFAKVP